MTHYLVTGGAGFIGSHLSEALLELGHQVTVIDNLSTGRFENIASMAGQPRFRFAIDSITSETVMDRLVSECDVVVHLAAAVGVDLIIRDPVHVIETNVLGSHAVLKAANRYRKKVLIASTSEIYGKNSHVPFREEDDRVLGPTTVVRWSYSTSKAVDEYLGLAYYRQMGLPVVLFRLFNTVGPRQTGRYGMVVPRFAVQALTGEPLTVHGDGSQARCFLGVQDAIRAIIGLAECPEAVGQVFNVGSTEEISIRDLAHKVLQVAEARYGCGMAAGRGEGEAESRIRFVPYAQAYGEDFEDMARRVPDITKIGRYLGWRAERSLETVLGDVLDYHAACLRTPGARSGNEPEGTAGERAEERG
jgi:UDP-glucose 4-epimerase